MRRRRGASAMRCGRSALKSGSTSASCAAAMPGTRESAVRSATARCSSRSSRPARRRDSRAISGASGSSPSPAPTTWPTKSPFCCPSSSTTPARRKRACRSPFARYMDPPERRPVSPEFVARVSQLLSAVEPPETEVDVDRLGHTLLPCTQSRSGRLRPRSIRSRCCRSST